MYDTILPNAITVRIVLAETNDVIYKNAVNPDSIQMQDDHRLSPFNQINHCEKITDHYLYRITTIALAYLWRLHESLIIGNFIG